MGKNKLELWRQLKKFFIALDEGLPPRIHKFNGGLFKQNEKINNLVIKDVFLKRLLSLNSYDFESDLNINILGHIFEQSITDIEILKKNILENNEFEYLETEYEIEFKIPKSKTSKRKKDGIFYTPENITLYIIKSTIGAYLENKKIEIGLNTLADFPKNKKEQKLHISLWEEYEVVLKNIKILDPACGSGAFLTQAFDYLLLERQMVLDVITKLNDKKIEIRANGLFNSSPTKKQQNLSQIKKEIVNNNLFGVDLNNESVEITKLGLWLKSASKNDPLALLDNNIKCGNSLISDKKISKKAFNWSKEFKEIIDKGGFDIIVGNPPYVFAREFITDLEKKYFNENYENTQFKLNTYILFIEKSFHLLKSNGYFGFIIPNNWLSIENTSDFRKFILTNTFNIKIVNSRDKIFQEANVDTSILIFSKEGNDTIEIFELFLNEFSTVNHTHKDVFLNSVNSVINYNANSEVLSLLNQINNNSTVLSEIANVNNGILAYEIGAGKPKQTEKIRDNRMYHSTKKHSNEWIKYVDGVDVQRYFLGWSSQYVKYGENLSRRRKSELFLNDRILVRQIPSSPPYSILASFVSEYLINDNNSMIITSKSNDYDLFYLLTLLNSSLLTFWFLKTFGKLQRKLFPQFKVKELLVFPIKPLENAKQQLFVSLAKETIELNKTIKNKINKFETNLKISFKNVKINQNLTSFYKLNFEEFVNELKKQKIKEIQKPQDEWIDYFNEQKQSMNKLISKRDEINRKIDVLVYKLYNLTDEEIKLIETQF